MIRRTSKVFNRTTRAYSHDHNPQIDRVLRITWWVLFIPVFVHETIQSTNL